MKSGSAPRRFTAPSSARHNLRLPLTVGELVPVEMEGFPLAGAVPAECPAELLASMERKFGKSDAEKFRQDWRLLPAETKRNLTLQYQEREKLPW